MMLGLAITALAVVVILISWIYKRFMEVRFFCHKNGFSEREADGVRFSREAREPSYTPFSPSVDC